MLRSAMFIWSLLSMHARVGLASGSARSWRPEYEPRVMAPHVRSEDIREWTICDGSPGMWHGPNGPCARLGGAFAPDPADDRVRGAAACAVSVGLAVLVVGVVCLRLKGVFLRLSDRRRHD